eukprot:Hpha_TRINITY_DN15232_c2_g7::TRINITY_DN15232_c2_g7_i2::g.66556::m.66556/K10758/QSOX; thiol oxidase
MVLSMLCLLLVVPSPASAGLYADTPFVLEMGPLYPWEENAELRRCPFIVEYYAHWCPHCQRYVPTINALGEKLETSPPPAGGVYSIATVDCADSKLEALCRAAGIRGFPTVKHFPAIVPPDAASSTRPIPAAAEDEPHRTLDEWWAYLSPKAEAARTALGPVEIARCEEARKIAFTLRKSPAVNDTLQAYYANRTSSPMAVSTPPPTPPPRPIPSPDVAWVADMQRALHRAIVLEPLRLLTLQEGGEKLEVVRHLVRLAAASFQHSPTRRGLSVLSAWLDAATPGTATETQWTSLAAWLEPATDNTTGGPYEWRGCRGSQTKFRGTTCGFWQMFHTITIFSTNTTDALLAVKNWISTHFGCTDCQTHFLKMAAGEMRCSTREEEDSGQCTTEGGGMNEWLAGGGNPVIWLWRAHNEVNVRLSGAITEDPMWPKKTFPELSSCNSCGDGKADPPLANTTFTLGYDEDAVVHYLTQFYGESRVDPTDAAVPPDSLTFAPVVSPTGTSAPTTGTSAPTLSPSGDVSSSVPTASPMRASSAAPSTPANASAVPNKTVDGNAEDEEDGSSLLIVLIVVATIVVLAGVGLWAFVRHRRHSGMESVSKGTAIDDIEKRDMTYTQSGTPHQRMDDKKEPLGDETASI